MDFLDFEQAAQEIKNTRYKYDDIEIDDIVKALEEYVEAIVDDINADPNGMLSNSYYFWGSLDKKCK